MRQVPRLARAEDCQEQFGLAVTCRMQCDFAFLFGGVLGGRRNWYRGGMSEWQIFKWPASKQVPV